MSDEQTIAPEGIPEQLSSQTSAKPQMTQLQWEQHQYARALKHCSDNGLRTLQLDKRNSRVFPPYVALWLLSVADLDAKMWVLTGDLPADHVTAKVAPTARDAMRHFSLNWQLKAENLIEQLRRGQVTLGSPQNQHQYASLLVSRAQSMYQMLQDERLWANEK